MRNLPPDMQLLGSLALSGVGVYKIITNELLKIFPEPEFHWNYPEYAQRIKDFLRSLESEKCLRLKIPDLTLYNEMFGNTNTLFCDLKHHKIKAAITTKGMKYINLPSKKSFGKKIATSVEKLTKWIKELTLLTKAILGFLIAGATLFGYLHMPKPRIVPSKPAIIGKDTTQKIN